MRSVHFILFALSCLCSLVWAFPTQFENTKVVRVIEINTGIAREDIGVRAKNVDTKPATDYYFYLPHIVTQNAASISAFLRKQKTPLDVALQQADDDVNVYKVTLNEAIQPQQDLLLGIKVTYTHIVKPMPAKLPQVAKQHTVYAFNSYFLSPYLSKEVKTTLQTPTKGIVGHTGAENKSNAKDNKIVYGPYVDVPPRSFQLATAHFENTKPMITVTQLERDIQVSHWGNKLSVEEHYAVRNDGAQLDSDFNRVKYMMSQPIHEQTNVWKGLSYQLPQDAHDPYYRDEVGNVSTSRFRVEPTRAVLEIQPRFPLFGGWNTTWYYGYHSDLSAYVRKTKLGKHVLNIKFVENVQQMTVDHAVVRIVLPEGSKNVKVTAPFDVSQDIKTHFTYFDSTGRVMIVLEKRNVVKEHELPIQIEYDYAMLDLLQKPLVASAVSFGFFVLSILVSKMSFTIGNEKPKTLKTE